MGIKNDKFFFLMRFTDGYAVLDESGESNDERLAGGASLKELIKYLQLCGAHREDIQFVGDEDDFDDEKKSKILTALPLSAIK